MFKTAAMTLPCALVLRSAEGVLVMARPLVVAVPETRLVAKKFVVVAFVDEAFTVVKERMVEEAVEMKPAVKRVRPEKVF